MAEITGVGVVRHLRSDAASHVLQYDGGRLRRSGRGLSFWFVPLTTSLAEVPVDDRDQSFLFHARSADFQDVTVQGVLTYRVLDPARLAERVDFSIDLRTGAHLKQPLERLSHTLAQLAERETWGYVARTPVREVLAEGQARIRERIAATLTGHEALDAIGLSIVSVSVLSVKPKAELEKALESPTRERIQQDADEAAFTRRAQAVDKERAIQENELANRIELAKREEELIGQQGTNARRQATESAEAGRIATDAEAQRTRVRGEAEGDSLRAVEGARVGLEKARMELYRDVPPSVLLGLAAQTLAGKLERIEHLNITPETLGPMLADLLSAGTRRLDAGRE
ncbi:MAG TPA: SPFH domain-containing protein [Longimicrobiales bacterium]|nr:SPFH domain-containing protein [Longimicrobiales bacterium]